MLSFDKVGKVYPGVRALHDVSFYVKGGEVLGLIGENGAGKSTLLKILSGQIKPDSGGLTLNQVTQQFADTGAAFAAGISVIHQELHYVPELPVWENLLLGHLPNRSGWVLRRSAKQFLTQKLNAWGVALDLDARMVDLSIGQRQVVEICKALLRDSKVIAFDEPTSSLSHQEVELLFRLIAQLRADGRVLIYVSHRMDEIFLLCQRVLVLRDGQRVAYFDDLANLARSKLVQAMVGREINDIYHYRARPLGELALQVQSLGGRHLPTPATFAARSGEIVGFFGLVGAGRSELMRLIFGADKTKAGGHLVVKKRTLGMRTGIADRLNVGLMFCSEDRKQDGIIGCLSVLENLTINCRRHFLRAGLWLDKTREIAVTDKFIGELQIKTPHRDQPIRFLSGGNQQKVLLARWLADSNLQVLIVDEPTRGIDVGAKNEIYEILFSLAQKGVTILVVSSELPEVLGISDRVVVMCEGQITGELARADATEERVLQLAFPTKTARAA